MDAFQQIEILWLTLIQGLGAWLRVPMRAFSTLGQEDFYFLVMPILYWSLDATLGLRVAIMLLLSNGVNSVLKAAFHSPRPYWVAAQVKTYAVESTFGLPSGHAQHAASIWGLIAAAQRARWLRAVLVALIVLIGLSRVYLGVHFASDVLAGWLVGLLLLVLFLRLERPVSAYLRERSLAQLIALAALTALLLGAAMFGTNAAMGAWQMPETWQQTALQAELENEIDPLNMDNAFTVSGTWLGLLAGAAWLYRRHGGFDAAGTPAQRLLRYLIGLAGVFVLWQLLGSVLPRNADALSYTLRLVRYTLVGLWIAAVAPLVFFRLGLAAPRAAGKVPPTPAVENPL